MDNELVVYTSEDLAVMLRVLVAINDKDVTVTKAIHGYLISWSEDTDE